jgi:hypothetical protein
MTGREVGHGVPTGASGSGMSADSDWMDRLGTDHDTNVAMIATLILLREGDPLADELLAPPPNDAWEVRRSFLSGTVAWRAAERMLAERRFLI